MSETGKSTRVTFVNSNGQELSAQLDVPPSGQAHAYALFAHCFTCNKNYKAPVFIARYLASQGIATLRFDFPGLGGSGGDFSETTLSANVQDVVAAAEFLGREYAAPRALIGHSLGGAAVLLAAKSIPSSELVVTIGTPSRPAKLGQRLEVARQQAIQKGVGVLEVSGRSFELKKSFFEDIASSELEKSVRDLDRKLLVIHAPEDKTVPFDSAEELMEWAHLPKSLLSIEGADHLLSKESDAERAANAIAIRIPK
ncbi:alpha/beta hydrolase [bacterium]|nr:alpha/beta hydrolase [bacterium]